MAVPLVRSELSAALSSMEKAVAQDNLPSAQVISACDSPRSPTLSLHIPQEGLAYSFIFILQYARLLSFAHLSTLAFLQAF